jgi:NADP-dependent 3-hydroxy acid dehydrogenase YdfG
VVLAARTIFITGAWCGTEQFGQIYFYQLSKAALNAAPRACHADGRDHGVAVAVIAFGLVNSALLEVSGYRGPSVEPQQAAETMYADIEKLTANTVDGFPMPPARHLPW